MASSSGEIIMFGCVQWCSLKGAPAAGVDDAHAVGLDNVEELSIPSPFEVRGEVSPRQGRSTAFTVAPRTFFMYGSPAGSPFVAAESPWAITVNVRRSF